MEGRPGLLIGRRTLMGASSASNSDSLQAHVDALSATLEEQATELGFQPTTVHHRVTPLLRVICGDEDHIDDHIDDPDCGCRWVRCGLGNGVHIHQATHVQLDVEMMLGDKR